MGQWSLVGPHSGVWQHIIGQTYGLLDTQAVSRFVSFYVSEVNKGEYLFVQFIELHTHTTYSLECKQNMKIMAEIYNNLFTRQYCLQD